MRWLFLLTITLTAAAQQPFDLTTVHIDANGLPRNAAWFAQAKECFPDADTICNHNPPPPTCATKIFGVDAAKGFNLFICSFESSATHGHINLKYATYEGLLTFDALASDFDYHLVLKTPNAAGATKVNPEGFAIEFDSRETLRPPATLPAWWSEFRQVARLGTKSQIMKQLNATDPSRPPYAIVSGLLGLDCEHHCHSELHPVYAIAIRTSTTPNAEHWAIMIRNWGNEGYCSHEDHPFPIDRYSFVLPNTVSNDAMISGVDFRTYGPKNKKTTTLLTPYPVPGVGVVVTVIPAKADRREVTFGELTIKWKPDGQSAALPVPDCTIQEQTAEHTTEHEKDAEAKLKELLANLPKQQQDKVDTLPLLTAKEAKTKSREATSAERYTRERLETLAVQQPAELGYEKAEATEKNKVDLEVKKILCKALQQQSPDQYKEVCK